MDFQFRQYQADSIEIGVKHLAGKKNDNGVIVLPTGAGKSIVIASIIKDLEGMTVILQPSKEILEQNYAKYSAYGKASIYSDSGGQKIISKTTFCTIGSIIKKKHLFKSVQNIIIDECHLVNSEGGMYQEFLSTFPAANVLGLTATPYRLSQTEAGPQLTFLTRSTPNIFKSLLYFVQNSVLFDAGYLAKLEYFSFSVIDRSKLELNTAGTDFKPASIAKYYKTINMPALIVKYAKFVLTKKPNILIFCALITEATQVVKMMPGAVLLTSDTKKDERERILSRFKRGIIKCLVNVGVLTTGFDYPKLEAVLMARSTMSLSLYYQIIGRVMRIHEEKETGWFIDLGGNLDLFGKVETMKIEADALGRMAIWNNGKQLTNIPFTK